MNPKLLLHACCAPCAIHIVEDLKANFDITLAFYGPNIHPEEEYRRRLISAKELSRISNLQIVELEYDPSKWMKQASSLKDEPEGGRRCNKCYRIRLARIAEYAKSNSYHYFGTTLTTSPYKKAAIINDIGREIALSYGLEYLDKDTPSAKKKDGFKKSCELSKRYNLYRQNYCGCIFSV